MSRARHLLFNRRQYQLEKVYENEKLAEENALDTQPTVTRDRADSGRFIERGFRRTDETCVVDVSRRRRRREHVGNEPIRFEEYRT